MATKSIKSQKTELFCLANSAVLKIAQVSGITGLGSGSASAIDLTTLDSDAKENVSGLVDGGNISFDLVFDPTSNSHQELQSIYASTDNYQWMIGLSDANTAPTANSGAFVAPTGRTVVAFTASVSQLETDFASDDVARSKVQLRVSGLPAWTYAS